MVFTDEVKVLGIATAVPVTPFTIVLTVPAATVLETLVPEVNMPDKELCSNTPVVLFTSTTLSFAIFAVCSPNKARVLAGVVIIWLGAVRLPPNWAFPFVTVKPLSAVIRIGMAGVVATPFTKDNKFPSVAVNMLELIRVAPVPINPFTVVVKLFPREVFETLTVELGADQARPFHTNCPDWPAARVNVVPATEIGKIDTYALLRVNNLPVVVLVGGGITMLEAPVVCATNTPEKSSTYVAGRLNTAGTSVTEAIPNMVEPALCRVAPGVFVPIPT